MSHKVFCWKDKRTWPVNWPGGEIEPDSEEALELSARLEQEYGTFIAYHACRPVDVSSYYKDGLKVACHSDLVKLALDIFASGQFGELSRKDVLAAAAEMPDIDDAKLYVVLDDRDLTYWCGHYLLYGSEYIIGIAAQLQGKYGRDYRQHLKGLGRPTILEVGLPFDWMPEHFRMNLASDLSRAILHKDLAHEIDFTVTLRRPIPPKYIRSHTHPTHIRDPLMGFSWHEEKDTTHVV